MSNRACPKCREVGRDSNGDHLFLLKDGVTWYCNKPHHKPYFEREGGGAIEEPEEYEGKKKSKITPEQIRRKLKEIKTYPIVGNPDRKISKATHQHFKIRTELSEETGLPAVTYYPETGGGKFLGYKQRRLPKSFMGWIKPEMEGVVPDFSGQHCCPRSGKRLLIAGGEEDMLAFYECLKGRYPDQHPAVVSLPRGEATSEATIAENLEFLSGFEEIIIGTDMDQAGRDAIAKIIPIIGPERSRVLSISEKDISDMWTKGKCKELLNAYYSAKEYRPSNIVSVGDIVEEAVQKVEWGLSYPWEGLTKLTFGLKEQGEIIGLGAAPGKQYAPSVSDDCRITN
jgi:hypothetical protein